MDTDKNYNFLWSYVEKELAPAPYFIGPYCVGGALQELLLKTKELTETFSFQFCPGASKSTLHHFYAGGLQQHIFEILQFGYGVIKENKGWFANTQEETVNQMLAKFTIVAVWHDFGKLYDYTRVYTETVAGNPELDIAPTTTEYYCVGVCLDEQETFTKYGRAGVTIKKADHIKTVGHLPRSYFEFRKVAGNLLGDAFIDGPLGLQLQHAILSHHGRRELGSPIEPSDWLSGLLHAADYYSAWYSMKNVQQHNELFVPFNVSIRDEETDEKRRKATH